MPEGDNTNEELAGSTISNENNATQGLSPYNLESEIVRLHNKYTQQREQQPSSKQTFFSLPLS